MKHALWIPSLASLLVLSANADPLPVDRGRIYQDISRETKIDGRRSQVEVSASTWRPDGKGYENFGRTTPEFGLKFILPVTRFWSTQWSVSGGVNYLGLSRTATVTLDDNVIAANDQQISVLEMPLGIEAAPKLLSIGRFSAFLGAGLIESVYVTGHSLDGDGSSDAGTGAYGDLGAIYRFGGPALDSLSLVASAAYRTRLTGDVDEDGFAASFGVRIGL